jgi:lysophospholipase L1-like esterase
MSYSLSPLLKPRFFVNSTNKPLFGGKLFTYYSGTTTLAVSYSDGEGTENANPIILDVNGECNLYLDDDIAYRLILKDANDVVYFDRDNLYSIGSSAGAAANSANNANTYKNQARDYALSAELSATSANTYKNQTQAQAAISTENAEQTELDVISTNANAAATSADAEAAEVAKNAAEAAILYHNIYSSTALGIAATSNGQRFLVSTANIYKYGLYNNNAGTAVYIGELDFIDGTILVQETVIFPDDIFFAFRDRESGRSPFAILNDADGTIVNQYITNIKTNADKVPSLYVEENPNSENIAWGVRVNSTTDGEKVVMLGFTYDGMLINPAFQELYAAVFGSGGTGTGDLAEADTIILHFPYMFAIENRELSFYAPSLLPNRNRNKLAYQFCIQSINSAGVPLVAEFSEYTRIPANALGTTGVIKIKNENVDAEFSKNLTIIKSAAAKTGSPVVLQIGDSLTQGSQNAVASQLALTNLTPSYIGSRRLTGGIYGEGRGGWRAADFVYINTQFTPLPIGQEATALALNNDQRNPFIRVATGGDDVDDVKNGYIFDFSFYLTRFGFATPNVVTINLGTNDINNDAAALANITESLRIMIKSIRATAPSCKIGIALPQNGNSTYFNEKWYTGFYPLFLSLHLAYGASSGSNIYLISSHAMLPDRFIYPMTTASTNANTGQVKQTLLDGTHFTADTYGLSLYAESIMSFIHAIS